MNKDTFTLGGRDFSSRFILGSGKYSMELIKAAVENAQAEIITLAVRRTNTRQSENILDYIPDNDDTVIFERSPLESIAQAGKMHAFRHIGFWKPMDTLRDNVELNEMWNNGEAPWKVW